MNYSLKHLLLAGIAMLAGSLAYAQVTTSSMGGRVTDEKGEPAVGAAVVATHEPSGTVYGAIVNQKGQYTINGMRAGGPYKVEVSSVGYNAIVFKDVTLQLAETYNLNATLKESTEFLEQVVVIGTAKSKFSSEKTRCCHQHNQQPDYIIAYCEQKLVRRYQTFTLWWKRNVICRNRRTYSQLYR